jgi:hypothetical protein
MNAAEAKRVLLLHRPGMDTEAAVREAMALANQDSELASWHLNHSAVQAAVRGKFRSIPVPEGLQERILAGQKIVRPPFWRRQGAWLAAAACFLVLSMLAALLMPPRTPDRFADFRARVVRSAIREYRMEVETADAAKVREHMRRSGAPADYTLTPGLEKLALRGGGLLRWRGHPVSMICFDRGDHEMIFLFVLDGSALKDAPSRPDAWAATGKLSTVSWRKDGKVYVLAAPGDAKAVEKYL